MSDNLQLIITCDDGGMSPGIDEAVIQLYEEGIASTVSVMSNMPHARTALASYREHPGLEIGVHLNLTEGQALSKAIQRTSIVRDEIFRGRVQCFMQGLLLTEASRTFILDELEAQIQVFIDEGISPAHITTHHHFIEPDYIVLIQSLVDISPQVLLSELKNLHGLIEIVIHPCTPIDEQFPQGVMYSPEERYNEVVFIKEFYTISQGTIDIVKLK